MTSSRRAASTTKCVLVVEDHEDNRRILRDLLSSADYEMIEVDNGADAVAGARTHPDLITSAESNAVSANEVRSNLPDSNILWRKD